MALPVKSDLKTLCEEVDELTEEFHELEACNRSYLELLEKLYSHQQKCFNDIKHQRYRLIQISDALEKFKAGPLSNEDKAKVEELEKHSLKRKAQLLEIEQSLPAKSGRYLQIILGDVNVSILNRDDKVRYKDEYEKFKLVLNVIGLIMSFLNIMFNYRALELAFIFLLVWYYCTLTIRESILKVNGSRIKGWWRAHHFISTVAAGLLLIWPQGIHWQLFRRQFMYFNCYISIVQYLQFGYQKGLLYRLKALGERHNMDITIEGFHSWMWRGLSFLLPFLFIGYSFQAYNAWLLYKLSYEPADAPWHVPVLCALFSLLFIGNSVTTLLVVPEKIRERRSYKYRLQSMGSSMMMSRIVKRSNSDVGTTLTTPTTKATAATTEVKAEQTVQEINSYEPNSQTEAVNDILNDKKHN